MGRIYMHIFTHFFFPSHISFLHRHLFLLHIVFSAVLSFAHLFFLFFLQKSFETSVLLSHLGLKPISEKLHVHIRFHISSFIHMQFCIQTFVAFSFTLSFLILLDLVRIIHRNYNPIIPHLSFIVEET